MRRNQRKLHLFHGKQMTLIEISKVTGIAASTLQRRVYRGISFDLPLQWQRRPKGREPKLRLTGDRDRDLKAIIEARHRDVIRRHREAMERGAGA